MSRMLDEIRSLLVQNSYRARPLTVDDQSAVCFEGETTMGCVFWFESADELVRGWQGLESAFLRTNAIGLRKAGEKTWNIYTVFLAGARASVEIERQLVVIEEDLSRTRKVARCGVIDDTSAADGLLPLLKLQRQAVLGQDDVIGAVRSRLEKRWPGAVPGLFSSVPDPLAVLDALRNKP